MYALVLIVHVLVCLALILIILVQGGRGGMAEALGGSGSQSLFGGGANVVMTKVTAVGAALFMVTCLSLAYLSTARGRSVIERAPQLPVDAAGGPLPGVLPAGPGLPADPEPTESAPPVSPEAVPVLPPE